MHLFSLGRGNIIIYNNITSSKMHLFSLGRGNIIIYNNKKSQNMRYIDKEQIEILENNYINGQPISKRKNFLHRTIQSTLNDNVTYVLNDNEKLEYVKSYDIFYFTDKYTDIKLRDYQIKWIELYKQNRFSIYNVSRQTGFNTIYALIILHELIYSNKKICIINYKNVNILDNIKMLYFKLPYFLKPNIKSMNNTNIVFRNSSVYLTNNMSNTNCDYYLFHDFAHNPKGYDIYKNIIPNVAECKDKKIIISSTPNGNNHFYDLYKNSILPDNHPDKNVYKTIQTYWYEVPGRDEKWKQEEIKRLGSEELFNREYNLEF